MVVQKTGPLRVVFCTGTFIAEDVVITAAHCVLIGSKENSPAKVENLEIHVGVDPLNNADAILPAVEFTYHPQYRDEEFDTPDLALIRFRGPRPPQTTLARLPTPADLRLNLQAWIAVGYGQTDGKINHIETDDIQQRSGILRMSHPHLAMQLDDTHYLTNQETGSGGCFGDSGSAGLLQDAQGNFVAMGVFRGVDDLFAKAQPKPDQCRQFGFYTSLLPYEEWINSFLKK